MAYTTETAQTRADVQHGDAQVQVTTTVTAPAASSKVEKIVVAVHGIGDQYTFATIQAVVNQFCGFYDVPAGVPLGNFHNEQRTFSLPKPYPPDPFERFAFAEVYWATIPRSAAGDKHTLEESKKWARTIVERLRLRWRDKGKKGGGLERDFRLVKQVLSEMIQTVAVLDRLCYLAERAGLFTFDLRQLLDDYLGDVQIVTEFSAARAKILDAFRSVLADAHAASPDADIYIVAHSQGTVVSLLGLLDAFRQEQLPSWANNVRGLMTLGSPIDKHLVLWPELFGETPPTHLPDRPIEWRNYYDRGDPVGFALDDARAWIRVHEWTRVFNFGDDHDYGFTRYPYPGKAHVDYWEDDAVFGHFLTTVMGERTRVSGPGIDFTQEPPDRRTAKWVSYVAPYLGVGLLLSLGVYLVYRAVMNAEGKPDLSLGDTFAVVWRHTALLFGVTVAGRVPRLTRHWGMRALALCVGALMCAVYYVSAPEARPTEFAGLLFPAGAATATLALVVMGIVYVLGSLWPSWGVLSLVIGGGVGAVVKIGSYLMSISEAEQLGEVVQAGPVWPVFLATAAFLYIWWLAALVFDLVVVWHWYIRNAKILTRMDELLGGSRETGKNKRPRGTPGGLDHAPQVQA